MSESPSESRIKVSQIQNPHTGYPSGGRLPCLGPTSFFVFNQKNEPNHSKTSVGWSECHPW